MSRHAVESGALVTNLYDALTGDEDARVCKDIPDEACAVLPGNFFTYLSSLTATKIGDEIASARLVLAWLLSSLAAPAFMVALLVPIRESGALVPQLVVAGYLRRAPVRKWFWVAGNTVQGLTVLGMAAAALTLGGAAAGWTIIALLILFSLARGVCSVAAKDVLGKTIAKTRRGTLSGYAATAAGVVTVVAGLWIGRTGAQTQGESVIAAMLLVAGALWLLGAALFASLNEQRGATEGGGNALDTALSSVRLLATDSQLRRFIATRALFLSTALSVPFYAVLASERTAGELSGLGLLVIASGLASTLSSPFWGRLSDRSSRFVLKMGGQVAGALGLLVFVLVALDAPGMNTPYPYALFFMVIGIAHSGVRLGRKTYLVDMATGDTRASYVALSNTVIGLLMLAGGAFGFLAEVLATHFVILVFALMALAAALSTRYLAEVE